MVWMVGLLARHLVHRVAPCNDSAVGSAQRMEVRLGGIGTEIKVREGLPADLDRDLVAVPLDGYGLGMHCRDACKQAEQQGSRHGTYCRTTAQDL